MRVAGSKVLVVDDDPCLRDAVSIMLGGMGCACVGAADGEGALAAFARERPDLVVLDVSMPGLDGFEVCEMIRERDASVPVIFLTARAEMVDKRMGFHAGGDDWLVKPFSGEELELRVEALLRRAGRTEPAPADLFEVGALSVNLRTREARLAGARLDLTPKEAAIVSLLAEHAGQTFTAEDIVRLVWGEEYLGTAISVSAYVRRIRSKLEEDPSDPRYLQTVWRQGYRMRAR